MVLGVEVGSEMGMGKGKWKGREAGKRGGGRVSHPHPPSIRKVVVILKLVLSLDSDSPRPRGLPMNPLIMSARSASCSSNNSVTGISWRNSTLV